jgi:hypothetical protein
MMWLARKEEAMIGVVCYRVQRQPLVTALLKPMINYRSTRIGANEGIIGKGRKSVSYAI